MYKTLAGYHIKPKARFSHWEVLLDAWIEIHEHYSVATKDAGYWYTERTNVGILAQAAWKSGFIALEEYQTKKMARHDPDASSNGRCDLWISGKKVSDVIEAKQQYVQLGSSRNTAVANSHLKKALADATRTVGDSGEDAVGLVFLPAYFSAQETQPRGLQSTQVKPEPA